MSSPTFGTPTLYLEHVPDYSVEDDGSGGKMSVELPGFVYFGVTVNGAKIPLGRKATAGLLADIARVKAKADADAATAAAAQKALDDKAAADAEAKAAAEAAAAPAASAATE